MREYQQIVEAFESLSAAGQSAALATVAAVEGSGYRRPGARMLVALDGRVWGSVSGGCLDRDVARRARMVIDTGRPDVCCYETAHDSEDPDAHDPGASLGCGGRIDVLIEPIDPRSPGILKTIADVLRTRRTASVATVIRVEPARPHGPVQRLTQFAKSPAEGNVRDPLLREAMLRDLAETKRWVRLPRYRTAAKGWADVLIERISPPQAIVIFGDGRDTQPLAEIAQSLGWHVTVVAKRPPTFRADCIRFATGNDPLGGCDPLAEDAAAIVMGHDFRRDAAVLRALRENPPTYLGLLGPRHRTRRLFAAANIDPTRPEIARRLFWPIGLDIGAQSPEQIALAIVSEIQAVFAARTGGYLRDRIGHIHDLHRSATEISRLWK